ncbi:MAG: 30S ribosomal protein S10 [Minisyncoccia bacterium]
METVNVKKRKAEKEEKTEVSKLRIKLKSYDSKVIDTSCAAIIDFVLKYDVKVRGPIPLPTEIKKYTVNRSTFVHKDSREQFEIRIHKRLIEILDPTLKLIESLKDLNLPTSVEIEIKVV